MQKQTTLHHRGSFKLTKSKVKLQEPEIENFESF